MSFLDKTGLAYFWSKIKSYLGTNYMKVVKSSTAPTDKTVMWVDTSVSSKPRLKFYDTTAAAWVSYATTADNANYANSAATSENSHYANSLTAQTINYLDWQNVNTVVNREGSGDPALSTPEQGGYAAGMSVLLGSTNGRAASTWTHGFWLYGRWADSNSFWYGTRPNSDGAIKWYKVLVCNSDGSVTLPSGIMLK